MAKAVLVLPTPQPPSTGDPPADVEALKELVRQGERVLDVQLEAGREQDQKNSTLLTLVGAVFGVAFAFSPGAIQDAPEEEVRVFAAILVGALAAAAASGMFLAQAYVGLVRKSNSFSVGWDPVILDAARREGDQHQDVLESTVLGLSKWIPANTRRLRQAAGQRKAGTWFLVAAMALLVVAYAYAVLP